MTIELPKTTELAEATPTLPSVAVQEAAADAEVFATASRAASTWRAYESDWRIFIAWCQAMDLRALPARAGDRGDVFSGGSKKRNGALDAQPPSLRHPADALGRAGPLAAQRRGNPRGHARYPAALDARGC